MGKIVKVGDKEFEVGKAKPAQIAGIAQLLGKLNIKGRKELSKLKITDDPTSFMWAVLASLTEEDLVRLAALSIGTDEQFARENFDLVWVSEALAILIEETNLGKVVENFTRIMSSGQGA